MARASSAARTCAPARRSTARPETRSGTDLPASNVIVYELEGGSRIILRPSGTEPKIKYYFEAVASIDPDEPFSEASERGQARLDALIAGFLAEADARTPKG